MGQLRSEVINADRRLLIANWQPFFENYRDGKKEDIKIREEEKTREIIKSVTEVVITRKLIDMHL